MPLYEPISTIMTKSVMTVNLNDNLREAESRFQKYKVRHLPVVHNNNLKGILSLTDLRRLSFADFFGEDESSADTAVYNMFKVQHVMISNPVTVQQTQTIREVATLLSSREFHAVPVLEGEKLVGIVSTTDLIRYMVENWK